MRREMQNCEPCAVYTIGIPAGSIIDSAKKQAAAAEEERNNGGR